jgi:hypothetical protein
MPSLKLYEDYDRKTVHDIFAPDTPFKPQTGSWGLHGIVRLPDRPRDIVLFVTFGTKEGEHEFDEGISSEGVLRWQSQPQQLLNNPMVVDLISHDESISNIYLFLRTTARKQGVPTDYTYLGKLKYLTHDSEREQPVHFDWQLMDWPVPPEVLDCIDLKLEGIDLLTAAETTQEIATATKLARLRETSAPMQGERRGVTTREFRGRFRGDYGAREKANRKLGLTGEELVVEYERDTLRDQGLAELADKVRHIAVVEGDGAGYDVLSFFLDGKPKYIEVKTTRGPITSEFYISPNEVAFSAAHADNYELRRLYEFDGSGSTLFYSIFGKLEDQVDLTSSEYKVSNLKSVDDS